MLFYLFNRILIEQIFTSLHKESITDCIELIQIHSFKKIGENHLLGLPIGIEVTLHSQQPRQMKQKAKIKSCLAFCELDELKQCISIGNGTIEVECNNLFHLSNRV